MIVRRGRYLTAAIVCLPLALAACAKSEDSGSSSGFDGNPVDFWRGALDEVHVYDRALSAAEVAQLAATAPGTPG